MFLTYCTHEKRKHEENNTPIKRKIVWMHVQQRKGTQQNQSIAHWPMQDDGKTALRSAELSFLVFIKIFKKRKPAEIEIQMIEIYTQLQLLSSQH